MITPLLGAHFLYGNSYDARKATLGSQSKGLVWTENRSQKQILLGSGHHLVSDYSTSKTPQGRRNYRRKKNEVFVFGPTKEGILNEHIRRQGYRNQRTMFHFLAKGQLWTYKLGDMRVIGRKQLFLSFEWIVTETAQSHLNNGPLFYQGKKPNTGIAPKPHSGQMFTWRRPYGEVPTHLWRDKGTRGMKSCCCQ